MLNLTRFECLGDTIRNATLTYKTNTSFIEANRDRESCRWSFQEFQHEAERIASLLQSLGFKAGDRAAILMQNQSRWPISATGIFWAGGVLVPLDYKLSSPEQAQLLDHCEAKILFTESHIWRKLKEDLSKETLKGLQVILTGEYAADQITSDAIHEWDETPSTNEDFQMVTRKRRDEACIVYSSGTGGSIKGCVLTHDNYLEQAEALGQMYPMEEDEAFFSILPSNHAIDFMCGFLLPMFFGGAVVHQRALRPEFIKSTMKRYGITHIALVPMLLKSLETRIREKIETLPGWKKTFLDSLITVNELATQKTPHPTFSRVLLKPIHEEFGGRLKLIIAGGAFVEPKTAQFFYRLGIPVVIGYGLTEAGTCLTLNDLKPFRADTVGKPIPIIDLKIHEENEQGIGEVWVKGPIVMKSYLKDEKLTREAILDGWLRTGDMGYLDKSGHLRLVGRSKNMIVTSGGKNVYPEDVESSFEFLDQTEEHCVFSAGFLFSDLGLENDHLTLVIRPKTTTNPEELKAKIKERNRALPEHKRVTSIVFWNQDFPRTASMKIKRNELAQSIQGKKERISAPEPL